MVRKYPKRRHDKQLQPSKVKSVRLSKEAEEDLNFLRENFEKRYGADLAPSVSMIIDKAIIKWAQSINFDEDRLAEAHKELIAESSWTSTESSIAPRRSPSGAEGDERPPGIRRYDLNSIL